MVRGNNFNSYQKQSSQTAVYDSVDLVIYPALGLFSEAGEVAGKVKKVLRDKGGNFLPEDKLEIADELGDVLWYIAAMCNDLNINMEDVAQNNLNKLNSRMARNVIKGSGDYR
jgi:NTP pyrophosphatase (non-canonical NTP hydrolase)|tara:strand:- start:173 stop:511 length:339 start_codon:yes stop_codon:yes gene_type:complete